MGLLCQSIKVHFLYQASWVPGLYYNTNKCNYGLSVNTDNLKVARVKKLL